ncbi:hypothetical protein [Sabulicella glaciei]|uniref:Uncharacterized protein n=1 Tax=Sabulicella glaciei TaxID=2984948 RepID=A0ABT3NZV6_9PROT|nr:hypothetical protein [Roseococcus sp. MDT2-1-1]MCW8087689.1 hypothetical protein [Roseococcus sp. MDT2-1-1]
MVAAWAIPTFSVANAVAITSSISITDTSFFVFATFDALAWSHTLASSLRR